MIIPGRKKAASILQISDRTLGRLIKNGAITPIQSVGTNQYSFDAVTLVSQFKRYSKNKAVDKRAE